MSGRPRYEGHVHPRPRHPQDMPIPDDGDWTYCRHVQASEPPEDMSGPPAAHRRTCPSPAAASPGHAHPRRWGLDILPPCPSVRTSGGHVRSPSHRRTCPTPAPTSPGHAHPRRRGLDILPSCPVVRASGGHVRLFISAPEDMSGLPAAHRWTCPSPVAASPGHARPWLRILGAAERDVVAGFADVRGDESAALQETKYGAAEAEPCERL